MSDRSAHFGRGPTSLGSAPSPSALRVPWEEAVDERDDARGVRDAPASVGRRLIGDGRGSLWRGGARGLEPRTCGFGNGFCGRIYLSLFISRGTVMRQTAPFCTQKPDCLAPTAGTASTTSAGWTPCPPRVRRRHLEWARWSDRPCCAERPLLLDDVLVVARTLRHAAETAPDRPELDQRRCRHSASHDARRGSAGVCGSEDIEATGPSRACLLTRSPRRSPRKTRITDQCPRWTAKLGDW